MSTLSIITTFVRRLYNRAFNNGEAFDYSSLDAQIADLTLQGNQNKARLEAISTPAGSLRYAIAQAARFTATAAQTAFPMPSTYDHTNDLVAAYTNSGSGTLDRIDDNLVTKTSDTVVTLPAQTGGATVIIEVRSVGNGTSQLASTTSGQGAGLVGYANGTGLGTQVNVQGALDELYTNLNSPAFLGGVLTLSGYLKADGSVALTGNLPAGGHKITGLGAGSASSNDAARMADITPAALKAALGTYLNATYVPLTGGVTMLGTIDFGNTQRITGLPQATASGQPLTFDQLPTGTSFRNAIINGAALVANGADYVSSVTGTYGYGKSELCKGALVGATVAGTLTRNAASNLGRTGNSFYWSAVTTTGAGVATFRFYVEAKDAVRLKNQAATVSLQGRHNIGSNVDFTINVYKATVADNFAALTLIGSGAAQSVPTDTNTALYYRGIAMGDCSTGILVEVSVAIGAVTGKGVEITEVQLEVGSVETGFEYKSYSETLEQVLRYYEVIGGTSNKAIGSGYVRAADVIMFLPCARKRTTPSCSVDDVTKFTVQDSTGTNAAGVSGAAAGADAGNIMEFVLVTAAGLTPNYPALVVPNATTGLIRSDARF